MPSIRFRRVYEPVSRHDGARVLIDRLWPRGIKKETARIDRWLRDLAPSTELRKWFGHRPERWEEFQRRYRAELRRHESDLQQLRLLARRRPLTLVYSARDTTHNDAVVLYDVLLHGIRRRGPGRARTASQPNRSRTAPRSARSGKTLHQHH